MSQTLRSMLRVVLSAVIVVVTVSPAAAQSFYRIIDVGTLLTSGQHFSYAHGVNDSGELVGFSYVTTGYRAFLYDPGTGFLLNLGDLVGGNDFSSASAVNNSGLVVGSSSTVVTFEGTPTTLSHAFRWESGVGIVDLAAESFSLGSSWAYGMNATGQVVGEYNPQGIATYTRAAFVLTPGSGVEFLPHLFSGSMPATYGNAISDSSVVAGKGSDQTTASTAYLWTSTGGMVTLAGNSTLSSEAVDINGLGAITGSAIIDDGQGGYLQRAFTWTLDEGITLLDVLPGWITGLGYGINDSGLVVGRNWIELPILCLIQDFPMPPSCYDDASSDRAFLWSPDFGTVQLDTLIAPVDPMFGSVTLTSAWDISNVGFIAANGYVQGESGQHAFLLIPILFSDGFESGNTTAWTVTVQ